MIVCLKSFYFPGLLPNYYKPIQYKVLHLMQNHNGIVMLIANVFLVRCDQISIMSLILAY